ncbi:hypothetical protein GCM10009129_14290 [Psychrobacter aestuarii]|uniref:DUF2628 domain-containing protein n=2 Tax=Psychrobacter aestuarii TaxID=556327 RepID=A0ABN0VV25_9GAMM
MKRFEQFDAQGYLSPKWHWAAFFMTLPWLLYRKRYMDAIVYSVAGWSFIQLNITLVLLAFEFVAMSYVPEAYQMGVRVGIALVIWVFWAAMVARWTDAYYYRMARREIADAINDYPRDMAQQEAHLRREGGVSTVGLGLGFGFFAFVLMVIYGQFLPIFALKKEREVLFDAYNVTQSAQSRVALIYEQTGRCPTNLPLGTDLQKVRMHITQEVAGVAATDCAVVATVREVQFPIRYLNGKTMVFYHQPSTGNWRCISSLNKKQTPKRCLAN